MLIFNYHVNLLTIFTILQILLFVASLLLLLLFFFQYKSVTDTDNLRNVKQTSNEEEI